MSYNVKTNLIIQILNNNIKKLINYYYNYNYYNKLIKNIVVDN